MAARRFTFAAALVACALLVAARADAADRIHLLVVGNNAPFPEAGADAPAALRFADDDAAAFYDLLSDVADSAHLLTVLDAETEAAYPKLVPVAHPPTAAALRAAVAAIAKRIEETREHGDHNVVYIFFSGHGAVVDGKGPALALLDGSISHDLLYDEVLGRLPADTVHVLVDSCHAEGVVRPRDAQAGVVSLTPADANAFLVRSTLARFPNVGAIVAATANAQAHEWDVLRHGVFTHELLSGLRGAADVNRDGRIEYSELYAFLASANGGVADPRARLSVVARPPEVNRRVAVLDMTRLPATRTAHLRGVPARAGFVELEDGTGRRIASLRGEPDFVADLIVPTGTIYVRAGDREARFDSHPGDVISFDSLGFHDPRARARGALEDAVSRGLFANAFGRGYYRGFIDQAPEFVRVSFADPEVLRAQPAPAAAGATTRPLLLIGAGATNAIANAFGAAASLRAGVRPGGRQGLTLSLDVARAGGSEIAEWHALGSVGWQWSMPLGSARGWAGVAAGGGMITQTATGFDARWSGVVQAGPTLGITALEIGGVGLWGEAELAARAYRRDGANAVSLAPSAFIGLSFGL
ncbi:MAG TPA: caspase family protein [Polyangia bacterium]|nr:caspase family protein [Polyangia bacterium]